MTTTALRPPVPVARRVWAETWRLVAVALVGLFAFATVWSTTDVDAMSEARLGAHLLVDFAVGVVALVLVPFRRRAPLLVGVLVIAGSAVSTLAVGAATLAIVSLAARRRPVEIAVGSGVFVLSSVLGEGLYSVDDTTPLWQIVVAAVVVIALLVAIGVGIYGLVRGPSDRTPAPSPPSTVTMPPSLPTRTPPVPTRLPDIGDAEAFARAAATALFTWDTSSGYAPSEYAQVLSDASDPLDADALASDVRTYLPTADAWAQLKSYQTRQWLTIDTATVPDAWHTALAQAAPGQLPPGATAYTITGTRHRTGMWGAQPTSANRPVSFTVFLACTPPAPEFRPGPCRLLRLSEPDNPLH